MLLGMPYTWSRSSSCSRKTEGERKGDVTEKHEGGLSVVFVAGFDVGKEGVDRVKGLSTA